MTPEKVCHECGEPVGSDGTDIVTTVRTERGLAIVGLSLCAAHKDDDLAKDKCVWAIQRMTGK